VCSLEKVLGVPANAFSLRRQRSREVEEKIEGAVEEMVFWRVEIGV